MHCADDHCMDGVLKVADRLKVMSAALRIYALCFDCYLILLNPFQSWLGRLAILMIKVTSHPFVPPIVCLEDYSGHIWQRAFPTREETREEARRQLETLEDFKEYYLRLKIPGLWEGRKDFRFPDPNHYLELSPKAPPSSVFRVNQSVKFSKTLKFKSRD